MDTKSFMTALTTAAAVILLASCNPAPREKTDYRDSSKWGKVVTEDLELEGFEAIEINTSVDVVFEQGNEFKVSVEGNENAIDAYLFTVEDRDGEDGNIVSALVADNAQRFNYTTPSVRLHVTAPDLNRVTICIAE